MNAADTAHTVHHPLAYGVGPLEFTGFGLAVLLAFLVAQFVAQRELQRRGHLAEAAAIPDLLVAAILGGLLGAKLYFVFVVAQDLREIFTRTGFVFWGGLMGGAIAVLWQIGRKRLPMGRIADVAGPAVAAAYAVGRTGCWAVGDDYGRPWSGLPFRGGGRLAVTFPDGYPPSTAQTMAEEFGYRLPQQTRLDAVLAVHPTQLYEVAMGLLMFLVLWRLRGHRRREGWLFGVYMVLAGIERFLVEFFRAKDDRVIGTDALIIPLTLAQAIAIAFVLGGLVVMGRTWRRSKRAMEQPGDELLAG